MIRPDQFIKKIFKPSWKKVLKTNLKAAKRFLNYQSDRMSEDNALKIKALIKTVFQEIKAGNRKKAEAIFHELDIACEKALPSYKAESEMEFQVMDIFVTILVIFALRTFIFQPYRIPTGSMQPTLNGIKSSPLPKSEWPSFVAQVVNYPLSGKAYMEYTMPEDDYLVGVNDKMFLLFLNQTELIFKSGQKKMIYAPLSQVLKAGLNRYVGYNQRGKTITTSQKLEKGEVLFSGVFEAGDTIIVNKMEYYFRKPKLGEVFVFDTLGINEISKFSDSDQGGGQNYIKRLCGLPGQRIEIKSPELYVDGALAEGLGFERVMARKPPYNFIGYRGNKGRGPVLEQVFRLQDKEGFVLDEYLALGDNTENSLDSRFWGPVFRHNIVGPAGIAVWPLTNGHFGFIK